MKKIFVALAALTTALVFTACTTTNTSDAGKMNLYPDLYKPSYAYRPIYEVNTQTKVSGEAKIHVLFGIFTWGVDKFADNASVFSEDGTFSWLANIFPSAKNLSGKSAFYDACNKAKCDAILAARYEIVTEDYWVYQFVHTKVAGYPAVMKGLDKVKVVSFYIDRNGTPVILKGNDVYENIAPATGVASWF